MPSACGRERKNEKRGCARKLVVGGQAECMPLATQCAAWDQKH